MLQFIDIPKCLIKIKKLKYHFNLKIFLKKIIIFKLIHKEN